MGLTTILRGFKIPVAMLDRFLEAHGIEPTFGYAPIYDFPSLPGAPRPPLEPESAFLRSKVGGGDNNQTRIFVPNRQGVAKSTHAYVAHAYVMVFSQRQIRLAADLPERPPPGFGELRRELLGFATADEGALLEVAGMQPDGEGEDPASLLFVVVTDGREYPYRGPFLRESDLRCPECSTVFESWIDLQVHRKAAHGVEYKNVLPDDL